MLQVEYAINNINNAGLCLGVVTKGGVILACEKESTSKLLEKGKTSEKIYKVDSNIAVGVGGLAADANLLIDYAREYSKTIILNINHILLLKIWSDTFQTLSN